MLSCSFPNTAMVLDLILQNHSIISLEGRYVVEDIVFEYFIKSNPIQPDRCQSDDDCPRFGRSQCLGTNFFLCFGPQRYYSVSGKCIEKSNPFCHLRSKTSGDKKFIISASLLDLIGGEKRSCRWNVCASCLRDSDCGSGFG